MKKIIIAALGLACSATSVSAEPLMKYNYFDASYQWSYLDSEAFDNSNGLDTKISYGIVDHVALEGGYNYANSSFTDVAGNINQNTFKYGAAFYETFCNDYDLIARVGGTNVSIESDIFDQVGIDSSDSGVYAGLGLRTLLTETLEGNLDATYGNMNTIANTNGGGWTYTATALQTLADDLALKVSAGIDEETNVNLTAGLRLTM